MNKLAVGLCVMLMVIISWYCTDINSNKLVGAQMKEDESMMKISSPAFADGQALPKKYTCEGADVNPALQFDNVSKNAQSLTLIVDDPDAPTPQPWVHWIVINIPVTLRELPEDVKIASLSGARELTNSFNKMAWGGACPPKGHGVHRYYFTLYALDKVLDLEQTASRAALEQAMQGHVVGKTQLMGTYKRI